MPRVYTTTEGASPSVVELSTPSQNVARPLVQDLAGLVALLGGPAGTEKGVAVNGVAGVLQDLTGVQQTQNLRRADLTAGSIQTVAGATGLIDVTLNATTTLLVIASIANVVLRSMGTVAPQVSDEGREVLIVHDRTSGAGFLTLPHNMAGVPAGNSPFFNSNLKPVVLGQTSAYLARAFFGRWRSDVLSAASVPIVVPVPAIIAQTLAYVDVSLVGTPLEGTPANAIVSAAPQVDLAAAALLAGFYIGCRMSATNTLRFAFWGALLGGNATFSVATL